MLVYNSYVYVAIPIHCYIQPSTKLCEEKDDDLPVIRFGCTDKLHCGLKGEDDDLAMIPRYG